MFAVHELIVMAHGRLGNFAVMILLLKYGEQTTCILAMVLCLGKKVYLLSYVIFLALRNKDGFDTKMYEVFPPRHMYF